MRNACKFAVLAVMLFLVQFSFADTIPTEGQWNEEDYYRSVHTNRPPVASIEGDILSLSFEDALSNLTVCVMNDEGVKVYEDVDFFRGRWNLFFLFSGRSKWPVSGCVVTSVGTLDR